MFVVDDGAFHVVAEAVQVPDTSTSRLVLTGYGEFVAGSIRRLAPTPAALADPWSRQPDRAEVLSSLTSAGIDPADLMPSGETEVDLLDVLLQLAWNQPAHTRAERARNAKESHRAEIDARSDTARAVLSALLDRYAAEGVDEVTSPKSSSFRRSPRWAPRAIWPQSLARAVFTRQWMTCSGGSTPHNSYLGESKTRETKDLN